MIVVSKAVALHRQREWRFWRKKRDKRHDIRTLAFRLGSTQTSHSYGTWLLAILSVSTKGED
jgi:hypothetical protein